MKRSIKILLLVVFALPLTAGAFSDSSEEFFVDESYDRHGRSKIDAHLQKTTNKLHFYVDSSWWEDLSSDKRSEYESIIYSLGNKFEKEIYDQITSVFGSEPDHRISDERRISVLFHEMPSGVGGYFNSADQYSERQVQNSNERNLLYLSSNKIEEPLLPADLGHEFMHLVTFAQKNREHGVIEEVWLNELRAEYMPTFLGYDEEYEGSNLQRRVNNFKSNPDNPLTEWEGRNADYGSVTLFGQYLVDHYGVEVLEKSLKSSLVGIPSIDYALDSLGYDKSFSDIFTDWTIAVYMNDCSLGEYYCYKNEHLSDLTIRPKTNILPFTERGSLSVGYNTKDWAGNWYRIVGGEGHLSFRFDGNNENRFEVPYVLCKENNNKNCKLDFIDLSDDGKGEINISEFGEEYSSLTIIPSLQSRHEGFNGPNPSHYFSWEVDIKRKSEEMTREERVRELLRQIEEVKRELSYLRARIVAESLPCERITENLSVGMTNSREVACLQQILKAQGEEIYPEGLVTGNFLSLTRDAVARFQELHKNEILAPLGLTSGTGYVGPSTRSFINDLITR